jgi:hypothetical protein
VRNSLYGKKGFSAPCWDCARTKLLNQLGELPLLLKMTNGGG